MMQKIRSKLNTCVLVMLLACYCLCSGGCGNRQKFPEGMPAPHPTVITVIQDDKPLEGASVVLMPMDSSNSWSAGALTDSGGKGTLKTLSQYDGVVPGKYYVLVSKREAEESYEVPPPDPETDPEGYANYMRTYSAKIVNSFDLIDPKFARVSADQTIEVIADKNEKTIDVGKAVRQKR